jgi:predicted flap endonuclease-1-like 5' DNA nuclease
VPVTKSAPPSSPGSNPPVVVGSASIAGAAVASLAAASGASAAAARAPIPAQPDRPDAAPPAPAPSGGASRDAGSSGTASEGMRAAQGSSDAHSDGAMDDLKRIRGIGVLIEKKLNSMGVARYEQIAKWTSTDIDRVSHVLDFKGRIERENWVEQARILASGGQTEFSRRADRGEFGIS